MSAKRVPSAAGLLALILLGAGVAACDNGNDGESSASSPDAGATALVDLTATARVPWLTIESPDEAEAVGAPFAVSGRANKLGQGEQVVVQLIDAIRGEHVVCERVADHPGGALGAWEATFSYVPRPAHSSGAPTHDWKLRAYVRRYDGAGVRLISERNIEISSEATPIVVQSPACNQQFQRESTLTVSGVARVADGALTVILVDQLGHPYATRHVVAGTDSYENWSAEFDLRELPPHAHIVELIAFSASATDVASAHIASVPILVPRR